MNQANFSAAGVWLCRCHNASFTLLVAFLHAAQRKRRSSPLHLIAFVCVFYRQNGTKWILCRWPSTEIQQISCPHSLTWLKNKQKRSDKKRLQKETAFLNNSSKQTKKSQGICPRFIFCFDLALVSGHIYSYRSKCRIARPRRNEYATKKKWNAKQKRKKKKHGARKTVMSEWLSIKYHTRIKHFIVVI